MHKTFKKFIENLEYDYLSYDIWSPGFIGLFLATRRQAQRIVRSPTFDYISLLTVVANTISMGMKGLVDNEDAMSQ
jgi:hypothetical protein